MTDKSPPNRKPQAPKIDVGAFGAASKAPTGPVNIERSSSNLPKPIQIRVPIEKHSEIKAYAAEQQMSITDLLMKAYEEYRTRHK
ncbi:hypothetical protein B7R56_22990 [Pseudomonas savastanoi pv. retacarpa]|uniref:Cytochrome C bioproteinsis protein CcmE n=28 Tax=Pseudomonas syringae group TaxID=136849 RepID=A0A0Q0CBS3_PSESX|nr:MULTISPECIES: hypothetical protein [Pseudomonas]EPN27693.1 hypothetical protein A259_02045 [Pseudomonas syringae pv. actinidiae ICMP 19070]KPX08307.1 hypothetical protein ALO74_200072 [Pseudomonas syringae pv. cunninghamiae]AQL40775.1 hypothetical protein JN853_31075 [Pseudomonas syringae pv. actinidiae ICMP 9853]AVB17796.1 hypothetical protein BKM19_031075 [Pseudomonas amygdali pv. morsprunorum]AVB23559.1 hypothetical protein BKM03_31585 [Pseudomonas avellanae]